MFHLMAAGIHYLRLHHPELAVNLGGTDPHLGLHVHLMTVPFRPLVPDFLSKFPLCDTDFRTGGIGQLFLQFAGIFVVYRIPAFKIIRILGFEFTVQLCQLFIILSVDSGKLLILLLCKVCLFLI